MAAESSSRKQSSVSETAASKLSPLSAARSSSVLEYQEGWWALKSPIIR